MKVIDKIIALKNKSSGKNKYKPGKTHYTQDPEFENYINVKTILQSVKELGVTEVTISSENLSDNIPLLEELLKNKILFSFGDSEHSQQVCEYFLIKSGIPVSVVSQVKSGMYIYLGGTKIPTKKHIPTLDLVDGNTEFFIRNTTFPIKINSFAILNDALRLTGKNISDIIIKPCIISGLDE